MLQKQHIKAKMGKILYYALTSYITLWSCEESLIPSSDENPNNGFFFFFGRLPEKMLTLNFEGTSKATEYLKKYGRYIRIQNSHQNYKKLK